MPLELPSLFEEQLGSKDDQNTCLKGLERDDIRSEWIIDALRKQGGQIMTKGCSIRDQKEPQSQQSSQSHLKQDRSEEMNIFADKSDYLVLTNSYPILKISRNYHTVNYCQSQEQILREELQNQQTNFEVKGNSHTFERIELSDDLTDLSIDTPSNHQQYKQSQIGEQNKLDSIPIILSTALAQLRTGGLFGMESLWEPVLQETICYCLLNWQVEKLSVQEDLVTFTLLSQVKINRFKYRQISVFQILYPNLRNLTQRLSDLLQMDSYQDIIKNIRQTFNFNEEEAFRALSAELGIQNKGIEEKVIDLYMKERQNIKQSNRVTPIKVNNKRQYLSDFIADRPALASKFRNLFTIINSISRTQQQQQRMISLDRIEEQKLPDNRCLGCSSYFVENMNLLDQTVNVTPLKCFPSVTRMKEFQQQIKDQICVSLNSGGAVLVFDCIKSYEKIMVRGARMNQKDKQCYQQRLFSYLDSFFPCVQTKMAIKITFVPVIADPTRNNQDYGYSIYSGEEGILRGNQEYKVRPFLDSVFVMRVKINPQTASTLYYWKQSNNKQLQDRYHNFRCATRRGQHKMDIKMKDISKIIKQKMKDNYLSENKREKMSIHSRQNSYFDHECRLPDAGVGPKIMEPLKATKRQIEKFQYVSMVIVAVNHLQKVKGLLREEGVECEMEVKSYGCAIDTVSNTAILYHNKRFDDIWRIVTNNPKFIFNGKAIIIINITNFLKLGIRNSRYPPTRQFYNCLQTWVSREFPEQNVRMYAFKKSQEWQFYILTKSIQSTIFAYYILNEHRQKVLFKNPFHLDKMDNEERSQRLLLLFGEQALNQSGSTNIDYMTLVY